MTDLWLAIAHHIVVFGLVIMLASESALVRQGLGAAEVKRLAGLDIGYGVTAVLIIVIGIHRVIFGAKGYVYYVENFWFWAKMASFALIAILSIVPTLRIRAWRKALKDDPTALPAAADIAHVRGHIRLQILLVFAVVSFAAIMARYRDLYATDLKG
jgi:putative membrane protein